MDILCDQSCNMGYIYLYKNKKGIIENYDESTLIASNQPVEVIENIYLKLNRLNWPDKKYVQALEDGDFIEEFQNDIDEEGYMTGIELELTEERLQDLIENFKIATFELNGKQFYYAAFSSDEAVFYKNNYVYPFTENEDAFIIVNRSEDRKFQINIGEGTSLSNRIAYVRAIIFSEDSPYDVDYLKQLKLYRSTDNF